MSSRTPSGLAASELPNCILFEEALDACSHRYGISAEAVLLRLEEGDRQMHSTFRYSLAKGLSAYLATLGSVFHEVYVHGSAIGESANPTSDIDVIVVVERRRDEIANLLKKIDLSLACHYRRLVGLKLAPTSLLDIHVVEREEQAERSGYGAVLDGLHTRPICLWRSDPANLGALRKVSPQRSLHTPSSAAVPT